MEDTPEQRGDPLAIIEDRLANPPKLWTPRGVPKDADASNCVTEPKIAGIVEETETRTGDYGDYPVVVLVRPDRSRIQVAGFGTILGRKLGSVRPGDAVGIEYRGDRPSSTPGMQDYADYSVVVVRDGAIFSGNGTKPDETDAEDVPDPAGWERVEAG